MKSCNAGCLRQWNEKKAEDFTLEFHGQSLLLKKEAKNFFAS